MVKFDVKGIAISLKKMLQWRHLHSKLLIGPEQMSTNMPRVLQPMSDQC